MTELLQKTISEPPEKNQSNRLVIYQPPEEHEKKHRAKIGHDLYRFPFIYIYIYSRFIHILFFCRAKICHAESLSMAQMGQGVEPSERIVTGGHGLLPSPLSGHGSRVRVIGATPSKKKHMGKLWTI